MTNKIHIKNEAKEILGIAVVLTSLTLLTGLLSGCTGKNHSFDWRKPVSVDMNPPEGPQNYQQGWSDGCESGMASTVNTLFKVAGSYKFVLDKNLRSDFLYNKAWQYGYNHCGYSMKTMAQYSF